MIERLNDQINLEMYATHLYWQMLGVPIRRWREQQPFCGNTQEVMHMRRWLTYLHETGALEVLGALPAVFEQVYAHEQEITRKILVHLTNTEPDYATLEVFLREFWIEFP